MDIKRDMGSACRFSSTHHHVSYVICLIKTRWNMNYTVFLKYRTLVQGSVLLYTRKRRKSIRNHRVFTRSVFSEGGHVHEIKTQREWRYSSVYS